MTTDPLNLHRTPDVPGDHRLVCAARDRFDLVASVQSERAARELAFLNALLAVSLEDIPLEAQLRRGLDLLLALPHFAQRRQGAVALVGDAADLAKAMGRGLSTSGHPAAMIIVASVPDMVGDSAASHQRESGPYGDFCVPLCQNHAVLGVLTFCPNEDVVTDPHKAAFLQAVTGVLAGMIARSQATDRIGRLLDANRQLNRRLIALQEEEYRHLARELHDQIGQSVAAIKTEAALLPQTPGRSEAQRATLAISTEADRIYETMHGMVRRLRPGTLDDLGLIAAIEVQVAEWRRRRPTLSCGVDCRGQFDDLEESVKVTVYRLVQESLTNIVRHAAATEVRVTLSRAAAGEGDGARGWVVLTVGDNGRGTDVARIREHGGRFGLLGMRERVEGLGGALTIESAPGRGFVLTARIPLVERRRG